MGFTWLNKQGVASDQGFALQRVDRFAYEYRETDRVLRLTGESLYSGLDGASFGFGFDPGWRTARWQPPFEDVPITESDREHIVQNIKDAMTFMDGKAEFD